MCGAAASSAERIFLFGKFSNFSKKKKKNAWLFHCFPPSFHRYLDFPHVKSGSISHNYKEIYKLGKQNAKQTGSL